MAEIIVEQLEHAPVEDQQVELVERKGKGHPDSICDGIANQASVALCEAYKETFGRIQHHNLDKVMLVAGRSSPKLGGGTIDEPIKIVFGDRGTTTRAHKHVDLKSIVFEATANWLRRNLRFVDPKVHVTFQNEVKPGSPQLASLFDRDRIGANDTSAATGFAPLTATERVVLSVEKYMNSPQFKERFPETGEDIKVMAFRRNRTLHLTIAVAFVDRFVSNRRAYFERKSEIAEHIAGYINSGREKFQGVRIEINTLDDPQAEEGCT